MLRSVGDNKILDHPRLDGLDQQEVVEANWSIQHLFQFSDGAWRQLLRLETFIYINLFLCNVFLFIYLYISNS